MKSLILKAVVLIFAVYAVINLIMLETQLISNNQTLTKKQEELQTTNAHIEELQKMLDNGEEQAFIEKAARERLGYVYPDEQVFIDPTAN